MARTKGGVKNAKRRRSVLRAAKGYRFARSKKERAAIEALRHAGKYAFAHRRDKKNDMRRLSIVRVNAALRERGLKNYSGFIGVLKKAGVALDRKILAELAMNHPDTFDRVLKKIS
ncbi:MAG: 50S ribosomal protein L20 [Patescibacteria group bacterium]